VILLILRLKGDGSRLFKVTGAVSLR